MAGERPSLGFEYEVALAKVDTSQTLTFAEDPYPAILGSFVVITCTKDVRCQPPAMQTKFLANGYNPAAKIIPAATVLGHLTVTGSDRAGDNIPMNYNGATCVARVTASVDGDVVRTIYCSYLTPRVELRSEVEGVGEVSIEGEFSLLR